MNQRCACSKLTNPTLAVRQLFTLSQASVNDGFGVCLQHERKLGQWEVLGAYSRDYDKSWVSIHNINLDPGHGV